MSLTVIGSIFIDIKGYPTEKFILRGRNAGRVEQVHGGVARNIAEDVARCGEPVTFVSLVDQSSAGTDVLARLRSSGVDTRFVRQTPNGMGIWLAVFDAEDVAAAISQRPDLLPIGDTLDECGDEIFAATDGILLEFDLEAETVERVFRLAAAHHTPVYAAVSNIRIGLNNRAYLSRTACFVCNEQEADLLFPGVLADRSPAEMAVSLREAIQKEGMNAMVVTLSERGSVYASQDGCGHVPSKPVTVLDPTGAGDAFFAGVSLGLSRGRTLRDACILGTELAAQVISTMENVCPTSGRAQEGQA